MSVSDLINVTPDEVSRDRDAEGAVLFVRLADGLSQDDVITTLKGTASLLQGLQRPGRGHRRRASITLGLGRRLFNRFPEHQANLPVGWHTPVDLHAPDRDPDLVIYATITAERIVPKILQGLDADPHVVDVQDERGARTAGDREVFGQA